MNTPRFRRTGSCGTGSLCLDTTLTPSFKNSTKNMYLAQYLMDNDWEIHLEVLS